MTYRAGDHFAIPSLAALHADLLTFTVLLTAGCGD